jgi:hypothetical protein
VACLPCRANQPTQRPEPQTRLENRLMRGQQAAGTAGSVRNVRSWPVAARTGLAGTPARRHTRMRLSLESMRGYRHSAA